MFNKNHATGLYGNLKQIKLYIQNNLKKYHLYIMCLSKASSCLAQLVERKTLNLVVAGSSPAVGKNLLNSHILV